MRQVLCRLQSLGETLLQLHEKAAAFHHDQALETIAAELGHDQVHLILCARHRHVKDTSLLSHLFLRVDGKVCWESSVGKPGDEHNRPLQFFGLMHGAQRNKLLFGGAGHHGLSGQFPC